ncbi:MAG: conjugal transfer protein TraN [Methyloprofundus sp.]|nr:conjugal transfer protein TraN [Methyloprofundus sp.]
MFKKTIQRTVSVIVTVTMLSSSFPVAHAETELERKQRIFNEAKDLGVNSNAATSGGITGGFTTPDGRSYNSSDIPGYNPNAAQESGLHSTFSSGRDDLTSITNLQSQGVASQPTSCPPVPEGDPGFQEYQYCLARLYISNKYQTATTNPYKSEAVDMKARAEQTNNPFLNALGLNVPLEEGMCVDSTVTIPGSTVEEACRDAKFTNLVGHTRSKAIEHWDYREPFCNSQHPDFPLDLILTSDKSTCGIHHCTDMTHSLNNSTKMCSYFYNQPGGIFLCSTNYAAIYYSESAKCDPGFELADDPANEGQKICRKFSHYACHEGQFLDGDMCQDSTGFLLQEQASCTVVEDKPEEDLRVYFCDAPETSGCATLSNDCVLKEERCTYYDEVSSSDTFGQCLNWFRKYDCPLPSVTTTITQCAGSDQICIDGNCFNDMQKMCGNKELSELEANAKIIENKSCQEYMKEEYPTCGVQPVYEMLPSPYNKNQLVETLVGYEPVDDCPWIDEQTTAQTYQNGCKQLPIVQDEDGNWPTEAKFACWGDRTDFFCKDYINDSECMHEQTFCDRYSQFDSSKCLDLESRYRCERPKYVPTDECTSDFAEILLGMETARQAGTYMDPQNNRIFSGEYSRCDYRRATTAVGSFGHKDCCKASAPDPKSNAYNMGEDLTGQVVWQGLEYGIQSASNFVYDGVMDAGRYFSQGADAWMKTANTAETASTAASGTSLASSLGVSAAGFTATLGSTTGMTAIASTGAAGTTTFSTAMTSGAMQTYSVGSIGPVNLTFNPAMFYVAVAIALYSAYQDAIACDNEDYSTATKNKGKLCYAYNSYCHSKQCTLWGDCTCTTYRTQHCCFNSKIARIINQQGKPQLGIPLSQCDGFTPEQFVQLDFSQIDLSEFVSDILKEAKKQALTAADIDMLQDKIKNSISASGADGVQVDKPLTMQ